MQFKLGLILIALASSSMVASAKPTFKPEVSKRMTELPQMEKTQAALSKRANNEEESENWWGGYPYHPYSYYPGPWGPATYPYGPY